MARAMRRQVAILNDRSGSSRQVLAAGIYEGYLVVSFYSSFSDGVGRLDAL